ncbi:MAG: GTP cyclohydrolase FolE2 [Armatimonadetes bacterium]|nr:GTP cyclohydrolase FolE2 [Armatimonadota bacterium]
MSSLPDMQNTIDERNIAIDKVGVRNVMYPIAVLDCANGKQHSIGNFQLTVDLPKEFKGTHMSRFVEILNQYSKEISVQALPEMLKALKERLKADFAHLEVTFPFFIEKKAPVSGMPGMMQYTCGFKATQNCTFDMVTTVEIPVTTLCPCSKEISDRGAHNQRGYVKVAIRTNKLVWIEEIISMVEACGSAPLYPLLKRPDEKFVTELAYDNPRFVEDMVREVALAFEADERITSYEIEVENHESIHAHNAYAFVARDKKIT